MGGVLFHFVVAFVVTSFDFLFVVYCLLFVVLFPLVSYIFVYIINYFIIEVENCHIHTWDYYVVYDL
jgi:hypothetical protein